MGSSGSERVAYVIEILGNLYGDIPWWPGTPEEVMIGAVLTQQTRWVNVENALERLKAEGICNLKAIDNAPSSVIEDAVRCTGFYRIKTKRLKALAHRIIRSYGSVEAMQKAPAVELRKFLLDVKGIGPETADSILCYALDRTSYVIDAYTERICGCAGIEEKKSCLKTLFEEQLPDNNQAYRQCHAWCVEFAKEYCGNKRCDECPVIVMRK